MVCFFQKAQSGQFSVVEVRSGHAACQTPHKLRIVQEWIVVAVDSTHHLFS